MKGTDLDTIDLIYDDLLDMINSGDLSDSDSFILSKQVLHPVHYFDDNGIDVLTYSGNQSTVEYVLTVDKLSSYIDKTNDLEYLILDYLHQDKIKVLYKDIMFESSYYGDLGIWLGKHLTYINNYFFNIIDEKTAEAIEAITIDSSVVLSIIDKYNLPMSRDLMLVKAIDKYSSEMSTLLESISNPELKTGLQTIIESIKGFGKPNKPTPKPVVKVETTTNILEKKSRSPKKK